MVLLSLKCKLLQELNTIFMADICISSHVIMPPTSEEVEGAYWFGSVRPVVCSQSVCDA